MDIQLEQIKKGVINIVTSLFAKDEAAIVNAWQGGERSMAVLFKLVKPKGMLSKSHIAYIIYEHFPDAADELTA